MSVAERFLRILSDQIGVSPADIAGDDTLEMLGADSLDKADLAIGIEEEFNFEVPDSEIEGLHTVGDFIRYIECNAR